MADHNEGSNPEQQQTQEQEQGEGTGPYYPVAYSCTQVTGNNEASEVEVTYYYEILRSTNSNENEILAQAETDLLKLVSSHFGLANGARCTVPTDVNQIYFVRISSLPRDEPFMDLGTEACYELLPAVAQTCRLYKGTMTGLVLGGRNDNVEEEFPSLFSERESNASSPISAVIERPSLPQGGSNNSTEQLLDFIKMHMSEAPPPGSNYRMSFLATQVDATAVSPRDHLTPIRPDMAESYIPPQQAQPANRRITILGGFLIALFSVLLVAFIMVGYYRRKRWLHERNQKDDNNDEENENHDVNANYVE